MWDLYIFFAAKVSTQYLHFCARARVCVSAQNFSDKVKSAEWSFPRIIIFCKYMQIVSWTWDSLSRGYRRGWSAGRRPQFMRAVHAWSLLGVFTATRFTGTPGWKRYRNVCRATYKTTRLHSRVQATPNPRPSLTCPAASPHPVARKYDIWYVRCMDNLISLVPPRSEARLLTGVFRTLEIFQN